MSSRTTPVVLVADDEPSMLTLVARHVRTLGYAVLEASDGEAAWQQAAKTLPDLVVLDVMMPGMSGWEVCRRIRESVGLAHTGVIMLTGIGQSLNELTSPLYGADAYIDKPFEFRDLDRKIQEVLSARGHEPLISEPPVSSGGARALEEAQATARELQDAAASPEAQAAHALEGVARAAGDVQIGQMPFDQNADLAPLDELAHFHPPQATDDEEDEFSMAVTLRPPPPPGISGGARARRQAPAILEEAIAAGRSLAKKGTNTSPKAKAPKKGASKAKTAKAPAKKTAKKAVKPAKKAAKAAKPAKKAAKAAKPAKKAAKAVKKAAKKATKKVARPTKSSARTASARKPARTTKRK